MTYNPRLDKVSANDTTPNTLDAKLVAGSGVTLTVNNDGANETLTIAAATPFSDAEGNPVAVDTTASADGTSAYPARRDHRHALGTIPISALSDVDTTGVGVGYFLKWNGVNWVPVASAGGELLVEDSMTPPNALTTEDETDYVYSD